MSKPDVAIIDDISCEATALAIGFGHEFVSPEHLLLAALQRDDVIAAITKHGGDLKMLVALLDDFMKTPELGKTKRTPKRLPSFLRVVQSAIHSCAARGAATLSIHDFLTAILTEERSYAKAFLLSAGITDAINGEFFATTKDRAYTLDDVRWLVDTVEKLSFRVAALEEERNR